VPPAACPLAQAKGDAMYARIARFEGGSEIFQHEAERLRRDIDATKAGSGDPSMAALSRVVERVLMLADRETGKATTIVFCETKEKLLEADRLLDAMSPQGEGRRTAVERYEVIADESPSAAIKAA
jgi:hypothetical protein